MLLHGDCLDLLPTLEAGSIGMVLCDLPYGTTACKWDSVIPFEPLWREYKRVCKPNAAIVLTASQPFTTALIASNFDAFKYTWVWEKDRPTGHLNAKKRPFVAHEDVVVFCASTPPYSPQMGESGPCNKSAKVERSATAQTYGTFREYQRGGGTTRYPRSVIKFNVVNSAHKPVHPTQKPVALMEYLIRTYTNAGDTVLDNTMGSGTTGVACVNTGRKFIGIERDEAYFAIAQRRIADAQSQERMAV
jgi:DNA modification methylase